MTSDASPLTDVAMVQLTQEIVESISLSSITTWCSSSLSPRPADCGMLFRCVLRRLVTSLGMRRRRQGDDASYGAAHDGDRRVGVYGAGFSLRPAECGMPVSCVLLKRL